MLFNGILTATSIVVIGAQLSPTTIKRLLGYKIIVDIAVSGGAIAWGMMTGTFSGMMVSAITALCISGVLYASKNLLGYQRYKDGKWQEYSPVWTVESVTIAFYTIFTYKAHSLFIRIKNAWKSVARETQNAYAA